MMLEKKQPLQHIAYILMFIAIAYPIICIRFGYNFYWCPSIALWIIATLLFWAYRIKRNGPDEIF